MKQFSRSELTQSIKKKAIELGFNGVGIIKSEEVQGFSEALQSWLQNDYHASMKYMTQNTDKRCNPAILVPGSKSVISLIISYYPEKLQSYNVPQIAKYAYGLDYHEVLKDKMQQLWDYIMEMYPSLEGRTFVDSAPASDKQLAVKAGLGWLGKNSCLINPEIGSFVFICELIINMELDYDKPYQSNFCGNCTRCIDNCPTGAIVRPGIIDSNKCISYNTIENKSVTLPAELNGRFSNYLFGCDICQDVCPWNRKSITTNVNSFFPSDKFYQLGWDEWQAMDKNEFNTIFKQSPLKRAKYEGLKRNFDFITKKV